MLVLQITFPGSKAPDAVDKAYIGTKDQARKHYHKMFLSLYATFSTFWSNPGQNICIIHYFRGFYGIEGQEHKD